MDLTDEQWIVLEPPGALRWIMAQIFRALAQDLSECFIDAISWRAKKGRWGGPEQAGQRFEAQGSGWPQAVTPQTTVESGTPVTEVTDHKRTSVIGLPLL